MRSSTRIALAAASTLALVTVAACSPPNQEASTEKATSAVASATSAAASGAAGGSKTQADKGPVEITDGWAKATDGEMSGAFATLRNPGKEDVRLVNATSDAGKLVELHETVASDNGNMVMRKKDGGFVIPAGGEFKLVPGGNHIMLMELNKSITPGQQVKVNLEFEDGQKQSFTVSARAFAGGNETYEGGEGAPVNGSMPGTSSMPGMTGMNHGG